MRQKSSMSPDRSPSRVVVMMVKKGIQDPARRWPISCLLASAQGGESILLELALLEEECIAESILRRGTRLVQQSVLQKSTRFWQVLYDKGAPLRVTPFREGQYRIFNVIFKTKGSNQKGPGRELNPGPPPNVLKP